MAEEGEVVQEESPTPEVVETEETGDQVEQQEEATNSEDAEDTGETRRQNKGVGKRINELTRDKYEAQREAEFWRQRAAELAQTGQPPQQQRQVEDKPPAIEDFTSLEDWQRATARYEARAILMEEREREQRAIQQAQSAQRMQSDQASWMDREAKARDAIVDYDDVIANVLADPRVLHHVGIGEALAASDIGPQVLYYLGKNPTEARQIAQMTPAAAAKAIGRIEAKIESQPKQTSKAPPPPKPVGGAAKASAGLRDDMPIDEWMKKSRELTRARFGRR